MVKMEVYSNENFSEDVFRVDLIHSERHYEVWSVKFVDMPAMTYGIVNKETRVIENLQPVLPNAKVIAKKFSEWLEGTTPEEDLLKIMVGHSGLN